ncbi:hypothetical protein SLEP1_g54219 [Rubroshorea leprosula]|uniref:Uncharacterized protein n=1 Tax=Rubroshorea leprosula TaxID=152421 RepID=A0AAV5MFR2_9ROSI|nr:hypothetical protein SLEP1_g54219 [Rubroshorea leprosula]
MTSAEKTLLQDFSPSNVPNMGYSLSDILTGIPEVDATPIMAPPTFPEDQNQSLSQFAELLKVLEEEGEPELHPGDVDQYYESLRDALLGDNEPPCYGW